MSQQVVTELVIDSNTSGADQFSQSMDKANSSAQGATSSAAGMSLAIAGVGVSFVAGLAALRGFVDYVGNQSQALVDMATHAELAGISVKEFQETLYAAKASGLTEKDFVSGLDKIGADIEAASRGVTEFGRLFEANGLSIKNANGELKTTKQATADLAGLMEDASPRIQQAIARIAGVSASWIPFLKQGVDGIEEQKKAAANLGIIIDDSVIAKAKEFNAEWKTATAAWDLQFKASLASILPLLTQMADLASKIIDGVGGISGSVGRWMTPDQDKTSSQLNDQINDAFRLRESLEKLNGDTSSFGAVKARNLAGLLGLPEDATIQQVDGLIDKLAALYDKKPTPVTVTGGSTVLPPTGSTGDQLTTEIDRLNKHIATTQADTEAVGQAASAQAGLRAEATLYAAAERAGKTDLEQYADQFFALREKIEAATQALNKAKIASDIKFGSDTAFLSQGDVQIASQLKSIYPDVATALNSAEAAQLKFNAAMRETSSTIETSLTSGLTDIVSGTKSASQGFTDMSASIIKAIEQMIIKITIVEPLMRSLQQAAGGLGIGNLGSLLGGGVNANGSITGAIGPTSVGGAPLVGYAGGTDSAPGGWSIVGENGPELLNLSPGAQVIPNGGRSSGGGGGGSSSPNIVINNHTDAQPQVSTGSNGDVTITLKKMIDGAVGDSLSSGTGMRVLSKQYGVNQFAGQ